MRARVLVVLLLALPLTVPAEAAVLEPNPWLARRVLNIAHQGGEDEAPSDTLFALKTAVAKGADMLEIDVHAAADGEIVVLHDPTVDRTTNGSGRVDDMTLAEIQTLDAAYWFVPGLGTVHNRPVAEYVYRGMATGAVPPEPGFGPRDFTIPSLREVLATFPDVPINIEIKNTAPDTAPYERTIAALLAEFGRSDDVIVVSFLDQAIEQFKLWAPRVHTATATGQAAAFWASAQGPGPGSPNPRYVALQVPLTFQGVTVVTEDFVRDAHARGLAVHVWTIDDREQMEWLIDIGVDGIMTNLPTLLQQVLVERGLA